MFEIKSFYLWLLQILGLLGLIVLCGWLSMRPKDPIYTMVDFSIPIATKQVDSNDSIHYTLEITNPNKDYSIYYDDMLLSFYYGQDKVGESRLLSFKQDKDKIRDVMQWVSVDPRPWRAFVAAAAAAANATTELQVGLVGGFRLKTLGLKSKHHGIRLKGRLLIGSDGKISGKNKKVELHRESRKWNLRTTRSH